MEFQDKDTQIIQYSVKFIQTKKIETIVVHTVIKLVRVQR